MFSSSLRSTLPRRTYLSTHRTLTTSPRLPARKDAQGKDDLKPESNEYSKSGSDQASAAVEDAAFNPNKTRPEEEHDSAGAESGAKGVRNNKNESNPLNASPANQELSRSHGVESSKGSPAEKGAGEEGGSQRSRTSGGGSAPKSGGGSS